MTRRVLARCLFAIGGGLLLFLADYPASQVWLVLLAFMPLLWLTLDARSRLQAGLYGVCWGLGRTVPLAFMLDSFGLPLGARVLVGGYLLGLDRLFALIAFELRARRGWPLLAAMTFAAIEYADSLLPMWGTARSVARLLTPYPSWCGLVRLGGTPAVAFAFVLSQALLVLGIRRRLRKSVVAGALTLAAALVASVARAPVTALSLRVALVGYGQDSTADKAESFVAEATRAHARLIVFPEATFDVPPGARAAFEAHWARIARDQAIFVVVPFVDREPPGGNRLLVFDATGRKLGDYTKRHLVPRAEAFPPGNGSLLVFQIDGVRLGTLICQDDNFSDLARAYAKRGVQILVVPTFEGPTAVAPYHRRNSTLRAIENSITLVRSVAQGESAVITPGGALLRAFTPEANSAGLLVADAPAPHAGAPGSSVTRP